MNPKSLIDVITLPFRLPGIIAAKVAPKVSILASDESLDRRILWGSLGSAIFGSTSALGFLAGTGLAAGFAVGLLTAAAIVPAIAITGASYVVSTMSRICRKTYIDSLAVKCLNAAVKQMAAEADTAAVTPAAAAPKTPDFNHVAATTLDKDIQAMPSIRLRSNPHALRQP